MTAREPLDLDAIEAVANAATPGPWLVSTSYPYKVWHILPAAGHMNPDLDGTFIRTARTALPALVAEVRALRAKRDRRHLLGLNERLLGIIERLKAERGDLRAEVERLTAQLDAIRALHTDSPAGVCPTCYRLGDVSNTDDGLVDWPCPTLRAMGIEETPPLPGPLAGYTVRPLPAPICGATDPMYFGFGCTKPAGHTGDRHTADVAGFGSYTWGYVPTPEETATASDSPAAIEADLRMVAATTGVSYKDVRELYDSTGTRDVDGPRVVTLCGSTRFAAEFHAINRELTLQGAIVLAPGSYSHSDGQPVSPEQKAALDLLHLRKIDMADEVVVVDVGGYVGESTRYEIAYAERSGTPVRYWFGGDR